MTKTEKLLSILQYVYDINVDLHQYNLDEEVVPGITLTEWYELKNELTKENEQ